jgi:hypothetical protein
MNFRILIPEDFVQFDRTKSLISIKSLPNWSRLYKSKSAIRRQTQLQTDLTVSNDDGPALASGKVLLLLRPRCKPLPGPREGLNPLVS